MHPIKGNEMKNNEDLGLLNSERQEAFSTFPDFLNYTETPSVSQEEWEKRETSKVEASTE